MDPIFFRVDSQNYNKVDAELKIGKFKDFWTHFRIKVPIYRAKSGELIQSR